MPTDRDATVAVMFSTDTQNDVMESPYGDIHVDNSIEYSWYQKAREIRSDPTVALARAILGAPIIRNPWRVQGQDSRACKILETVLFPIRSQIMRSAVNSGIDYGWNPWEVRPQKTSELSYCRLKPLRHERTEVVLRRDGFPHHLLNTAVTGYSTDPVKIPDPYFAITAAGEEYGNCTGYPLLKNVEKVNTRYEEVEEAVSRHIKKVAGAHWALWYPVGYSEEGGEKVDNAETARKVLASLKASGTVALPVSENDFRGMMMESTNSTTSNNKSAWDLKLIESKGGIDPFLDRQKYLDALKMRALFVPERTALEGQFGTKAESSEHADIAIMAIEQWGQGIVDWINSPYGFVGSVFAFNGIQWYPGCAEVIPLPLADDDKSFLREVLRTILNLDQVYSKIVDLESLGMRSGVPMMDNANQVLENALKEREEKAKALLENPKEIKQEEENDGGEA